MKRTLDVVRAGDTTEVTAYEVVVGNTRVSVAEAGDGTEAARFSTLLQEAGEARAGRADDPTAELRIVIRTVPRDRGAIRRQRELEANADVVLGSARPAFAQRLAQSFLGD